MLCQVCEKNKASIHFTKIINGHVEEGHLCESCAKEHKEFDFDLPFSFQKLFTGLIGFTEDKQEEKKKTICPVCGLTYKKFMEIGKFGCAQCYETFREDIKSLLKGIHGHQDHKGKVSQDHSQVLDQEREIESLQGQLKESIEEEDFEKAAYLRDEIRKLKGDRGKIGGSHND